MHCVIHRFAEVVYRSALILSLFRLGGGGGGGEEGEGRCAHTYFLQSQPQPLLLFIDDFDCGV